MRLEALGIINPWCSGNYFKAQVLPLCPLCLSSRGVARTVLDSKSKVRRRRVHDCRRCKGCTFFLFLCELIILKRAVMAPVILSYLQWFPLERRLIQGNFLSTFRSVSPPSFSTIFELQSSTADKSVKVQEVSKMQKLGQGGSAFVHKPHTHFYPWMWNSTSVILHSFLKQLYLLDSYIFLIAFGKNKYFA